MRSSWKITGDKTLYFSNSVSATPGIIKYNFWKYAYNWRNAFYVCINKGDAYVPKEIENKTVGVDADLAEVIEKTSSLT